MSGNEREDVIDAYYNSPIVMMNKKKEQKNVLLIPNAYMLQVRGWSLEIRGVKLSSVYYSWEAKEEKAFWRGASTGIYVSTAHTLEQLYVKAARYKLVHLSNSHPTLLDAKISKYVQIEPALKQKVVDFYGPASGEVNVMSHLKYKYLISGFQFILLLSLFFCFTFLKSGRERVCLEEDSLDSPFQLCPPLAAVKLDRVVLSCSHPFPTLYSAQE